MRVLLYVFSPTPYHGHRLTPPGGPCDLVQQDKEAEFREQQRLGMPVPIQQQPDKVQGMQYPQQQQHPQQYQQQGYQQQGYAQPQYTQ